MPLHTMNYSALFKKLSSRLQKYPQSFGIKPGLDHAGVTGLLLALGLGLD